MISLLAVLGCTGGSSSVGPTNDVRVDHGEESEATLPRICTGDGIVHAVWQEDRGGVSGVYYNRSADGGKNWLTTDARVSRGEAAATAPDVGCSGDSVIVVWEDERDGELANRNIYASVSSDGGNTFPEEDVRIDADIEGDAMSLAPRISMWEDSAYVAWFDNTDGAYDIRTQYSNDAGATWSETPGRADSDDEGSAYSAWPSIAAGPEGAALAWEDTRNGVTDIYGSTTDDGLSWRDDSRLDKGDDATDSFEPTVSVSGANVVVAWHDERNGKRDILLSSTADFQTWLEEPLRVETDPVGNAESLHPVVAMSGDVAHLAWQDDRSGGFDIYYRNYQPESQAFSEEDERLDTDSDGESQSYYPALAAVETNIFVTWQDYREDRDNVGFNDLYYNFSQNGGKNWNNSDLRINSIAPGSSYAISAAPALFGESFLTVWCDGRDGTGDIYSATRALGESSVYVEAKASAE